MASPIGNPANLGSGVDQMLAQIRAMIRDEIQAAASGGAGLHVDGATGDLVADRGQFRSLNFVPGSAGWGMGPSGNAEFNDLTLRGGIIGNAALTSPVQTDAIYANASNFGVTTGSVTKVSLTITVPAGFTKAAVSVIGRVFAINNNTTGGSNGTGGDYLYADARIAGHVGLGLPLPVTGSNNSNMNVAPYAYVLPGLTPGGTFTILINAATSFLTWVAQASNQADLTGTIGWYR